MPTARQSCFSPPSSLSFSLSLSLLLMIIMRVAEIATLALYLPNKLGPKKRLKNRSQTESRADNVPRCCCCCCWHKCLTSCFAWTDPKQQQAKSAIPVARPGPGSNNNMWLMWEKTSRMRVEMLHASPSPKRQLKLQLHLHFQLQFSSKSYAKTAEGRARSALATWLCFFGLTYLANFALGTKQFTLCSQ